LKLYATLIFVLFTMFIEHIVIVLKNCIS